MHCPYCGTPVVLGAASCVRCGIGIQWDGDEASFEDAGTFVEVHRALDPASLPVIESLLESNGVPFVVANEMTQDLVGLGRFAGGYNNTLGPPVVRVPASRADEARELLAATLPSPPQETLPEE